MPSSLRELLQDISPMPYVCWPILPLGGVLVIGAAAKSQKSMLALNLAYSLSEPRDFAGFAVKSQQRVLYIDEEIGPWGMRDRLRSIHAACQGVFALDNLVLEPKSRIHYALEEGSAGFRNLDALVAAVRPNVLILDPLREFHLLDENDSTAMTRVFKGLYALKEAHNLTVVLVHHAGKRNEYRDASNPESLRGSSKIFDVGDSYCIIERPVTQPREPDTPQPLRLFFRFRHAADIEPVSVFFDPRTLVIARAPSMVQ